MLTLYSREDCPLCEEVEELLLRLNIEYSYVNIDHDETLRKKYHVRIPVIENANKQELLWPFNDQQLLDFSS